MQLKCARGTESAEWDLEVWCPRAAALFILCIIIEVTSFFFFFFFFTVSRWWSTRYNIVINCDPRMTDCELIGDELTRPRVSAHVHTATSIVRSMNGECIALRHVQYIQMIV